MLQRRRGFDLLRYLRLEDWGVQLPIFWITAAIWRMALPGGADGYWTRVLAVSCILAAALSGGYVLNDYFDRHADGIAKGRTMSGLEAAGRLVAGLGVVLSGIGLAALLLRQSSAVIFAAAWALLGVAYSAPPVRFKEWGAAGLAAATLLQRIPPFVLLILGYPGEVAVTAAMLSWLAALGLVFIVEHQLEDYDTDSAAGLSTYVRGLGRGRGLVLRDWVHRFFLLASVAAAAMLAAGEGGLDGAAMLAAISVIGVRLLRMRYAGNRRLPCGRAASWVRQPERLPDLVRVYGAGLGGLTAAIKLADWGVPVELHEQLRVPGGIAAATCGVHAVMSDPVALERYLGIPLGDCFEPVRREVISWYGWHRRVRPRHWNCLRGGEHAALDRRLLDVAVARGVTVIWSSPFRAAPEDASTTIVAIGHARRAYEMLGLPCETLDAFWATMPYDGEPLLLVCRSREIDPDYGYAASAHGWISGLVFARGQPVRDEAITFFERRLWELEGVRFPSWKRGRGAVGTRAQLEWRGCGVAGAAAGMLDPVFLSGVGQSMVSGGVAALHTVDRRFGADEFRRFTATMGMRQALRQWARRPRATGAERLAALAASALVPPAGSLPGRPWKSL